MQNFSLYNQKIGEYRRDALAHNVAEERMPPWPKADSWQLFDGCGKRKYVTAGERAALLAAVATAPVPTKALVLVLIYTGCRISEALSLTRGQLDTERGELALRTLKRRRLHYRIVPVPPAVVQALLALPVEAGAPERFFHWHRSTAWRRIKAFMARAGICGTPASPKGLRHGFGMRAAEKNVPPALATRWLGHASARTTAIYQTATGPEERAYAARMW
ncbi:tyrosine-type recombinase/integrase [Jiella sonneratiae]|uniref:Site-specific integrase n=1 Tax=Jiella sonneratiae TaxID=2816856 RepID=A0ABS3J9D8_9HYPH|nr:site-specific integrase [Jiella sonneratiae]MBO0906287.1 site-specific integrase [Jiella sonneratiae]